MRARAVLLAFAALVVDRDARPCSIVNPPQVLPASQPAPVNAHVWIRNPPRHTRDVYFVVRVVAPAISEIPIATREWCPLGLVELVPQSALPPSSRFEVWMVARAAPGKPVLLASFGTGTATDTTPPPRPAFTKADHEVESGQCGTFHGIALSGGSDQPETLYAMWSADAKGAIVWEAAPIAVFTGSRVDGFGTCTTDFSAWSASSPHVGIRAMDIAGNLGAPIELTVLNK